MGRQRSLDRTAKELIALAVSTAHDCDYCAAAHETTALKMGATPEAVAETKQIVELFASFSRIADSLRIPLEPELHPENLRQSQSQPPLDSLTGKSREEMRTDREVRGESETRGSR